MLYLRAADAADAPAIARLHAESWRRNYRGIWRDAYLDGPVYADRAEVWHKRLSDPADNQRILLAVDGENLAGFACLYLHDDPVFGTLLDNLHVSYNYQGKGIGAQLIRAAAGIAQAQAPEVPFYLWVLEGNQAARGFYEKSGGVHRETTEAMEPDGGTSVICRYVWERPGRVG